MWGGSISAASGWNPGHDLGRPKVLCSHTVLVVTEWCLLFMLSFLHVTGLASYQNPRPDSGDHISGTADLKVTCRCGKLLFVQCLSLSMELYRKSSEITVFCRCPFQALCRLTEVSIGVLVCAGRLQTVLAKQSFVLQEIQKACEGCGPDKAFLESRVASNNKPLYFQVAQT